MKEEKKFLKALKRFIPRIQKAKDGKMNEADTRFMLRTMLGEAFGYDLMEDISSENMIRGKFVDFSIKLKGEPIFFIEAKSADTLLKDKHARQAAEYASMAGVNYALVTNLSDYWLYQIEMEDRLDWNDIFKVNILDEENLEESAEKLWRLTKKAFKKGELDKFSKIKESLSEENLLKALVSEKVTKAIRKEIRKITDEFVSLEAIEKAIHDQFPIEVTNLIRSTYRKSQRKKAKSGSEAVKTCSEPGCDKIVYSKGLCRSHYCRSHYQKKRKQVSEETEEKMKEASQPEPDKIQKIEPESPKTQDS